MAHKQSSAYVAWQNRAFRFYLAARLLLRNEQHAPAAFCAIQCVELLMKGTLIYWDASFASKTAGHNIGRLMRRLRAAVPEADGFTMPQYFLKEEKFYSVTRYVTPGNGVIVPSTLLVDLDDVFAKIVTLVPFQFNSELRRALAGKSRRNLTILRTNNRTLRRLRQFLR